MEYSWCPRFGLETGFYLKGGMVALHNTLCTWPATNYKQMWFSASDFSKSKEFSYHSSFLLLLLTCKARWMPVWELLLTIVSLKLKSQVCQSSFHPTLKRRGVCLSMWDKGAIPVSSPSLTHLTTALMYS